MRLQLQTCLLVAVGCLFAFQSQAQAQCASCDQAAAVAVGPTFVQAAPTFQDPSYLAAPAAHGCGCKRGGGGKGGGCKGGGHKRGCGCKGGGHRGGIDDTCKPTGPTVQGELPVLPIRAACDSPWGRDDVPSLFTPPRSYLPPIGKAVGRPLLGRWTGY